jgi:hypothetical protein
MSDEDRIPWKSNYLWGSGYTLAAHWASKKPGEGHTNLFTNKAELGQLAADTITGLKDDFDKNYKDNHKYSFAEVLARKCRSTRPVDRGGKDAFNTRIGSRPEWAPAVDLIRTAVDRRKVLRIEDILHIQQTEQLLTYTGSPGVYLSIHGRHHEDIRIGKGKDLGSRPKNHGGYGYYLVRGYPTADIVAAKDLENILIAKLDTLVEQGKVWKKDGTRGCYSFNNGNGVEFVDRMMREDYHTFYRQTGKYTELWVPPEPDIILPSREILRP